MNSHNKSRNQEPPIHTQTGTAPIVRDTSNYHLTTILGLRPLSGGIFAIYARNLASIK